MVVEVVPGPKGAGKQQDSRGLPPMDVASRVERLREGLAEERLGGILVTSLTNVRYLCGFSGSAGMLLVTADELVLFTDGKYRDQSVAEIAEARVPAETSIGRVSEQLSSIGRATRNGGRLGIEAGATSVELLGRIAEVTKSELVATNGLVEALRVVKDAGEIARIERACEIADVALAQTKEHLVDGPSEREFAAELEYEMRRRGADGVAFESIVAGGPNAALPHAQPTDRPITPGELVVIDFGARFDGYRSDMTRTVCVGDPVGETAAVLDAVAASQRAGLLAVAAGVTGGEVDAACRRSLEEAGYGEAFTHSTGHGIGLDIHEAPAVAKDSADVLAENTVITVEPGVYLVDKLGARIEDTVVVTASGFRPLTKTTKDPRI